MFSRCFAIMLLLLVCGSAQAQGGVIELTMLYPPEYDRFMQTVITDFEAQHPEINIQGERASSGSVSDCYVEYVNSNSLCSLFTSEKMQDAPPDIWIPAVSHWLILANARTSATLGSGIQLFDMPSTPTSRAAVVVAIWNKQLNALAQQTQTSATNLGWSHLLQLFETGWDLSSGIGRTEICYGHTNPFTSSTGLSALMMELYASQRYITGDTNPATIAEVLNADLIAQLQNSQSLLVQRSNTIFNSICEFYGITTDMRERIAISGPEKLDFALLSEDDFLQVKLCKTEVKAPGCDTAGVADITALYPSEGTFIHDYPFAIPHWLKDPSRTQEYEAALNFQTYMLGDSVQNLILSEGFRPVSLNVSLANSAFEVGNINTVSPELPPNLFSTDNVDVTSIQEYWCQVKKPTSIYVVVDNSTSMQTKLAAAQSAIKQFLTNLAPTDSVGLITFASDAESVVRLGRYSDNRDRINDEIDGMRADGSTALYDAIQLAIRELSNQSGNTIKAIVVLSDGENSITNNNEGKSSDEVFADIKQELELINEQGTSSPITVIPISYFDANQNFPTALNALEELAKLSNERVYTSTTDAIEQVFAEIGGYFNSSPLCQLVRAS